MSESKKPQAGEWWEDPLGIPDCESFGWKPPVESPDDCVPNRKRVPVDLIAAPYGNAIWRERGVVLLPTERFIHSDGNGGWYVETPA